MSWGERAARKMLEVAVSRLAARRRAWAEALRAEAEAIQDPQERSRWSLSAALGACRIRIRDASVRFLLPAGFVLAGLLVLDHSPSDVANQACVVALLLGSVALAFANPHAVRAVVATVGLAIPVAHAFYMMAGIDLPYESRPSGWAGPVSLLVLVVPAAAGAFAGAAARRALGPIDPP